MTLIPEASTSEVSSAPSARHIDPRGGRFSAVLTSIVLAVVLIADSAAWGVALLAVQTAFFAAGAFIGPQRTPYALLYRRVVRPRLGPPSELEDVAPPQFAQAVGLVFALVALLGFAVGLPTLGLAATAMALAAAFLNAAFGFCLGCELYLFGRRLTS